MSDDLDRISNLFKSARRIGSTERDPNAGVITQMALNRAANMAKEGK